MQYPESLIWLSNNQWAFWIFLNISAYITYRLLKYSIVGEYGFILPIITGTITVIWADKLWIGGIGVAFIVLTAMPFLILLIRKETK
jgi:hypothetical protein